MERQEMTALDAYINRVYKIIVLIIPIFCLCAAGSITTMQANGWYPPINPALLTLFDISTIVYLMIGKIHFNCRRILDFGIATNTTITFIYNKGQN